MLKTNAISYNYKLPRLTYPSGCLSFPAGQTIEVGRELRLLGAQLQEDFSFNAHCQERRSAGLYAAYQLNCLCAQGVQTGHLKTVYLSFIRSVTEYGLLPSATLMTDENWKAVKAVQRRCTRVLLGHQQKSFAGDTCPEYDYRLQTLKMERCSNKNKEDILQFYLEE